jgi:hypothetical protein
LEGELQGRVILVVGAAGATLRDLNRRASRGGHRLLVVSLGGDVDVVGEAHAAVMLLGPGPEDRGVPGRLGLGSTEKLVGALLVPEPPPGGLKAEGVLRYDPELYAAYPPKQTLKKSHRGDYVVAVSPAPVMADGGAR